MILMHRVCAPPADRHPPSATLTAPPLPSAATLACPASSGSTTSTGDWQSRLTSWCADRLTCCTALLPFPAASCHALPLPRWRRLAAVAAAVAVPCLPAPPRLPTHPRPCPCQVAVRKRAGIRADSKLEILAADKDMYVARCNGSVVIKLGPRFGEVFKGHGWLGLGPLRNQECCCCCCCCCRVPCVRRRRRRRPRPLLIPSSPSCCSLSPFRHARQPGAAQGGRLGAGCQRTRFRGVGEEAVRLRCRRQGCLWPSSRRAQRDSEQLWSPPHRAGPIVNSPDAPLHSPARCLYPCLPVRQPAPCLLLAAGRALPQSNPLGLPNTQTVPSY